MRPLFISCNALQAPDIPSEYEVLVDDPGYGDIGPMAALLTAFKHHPQVAFMVVGCDYPYILATHLQELSKATLEAINAAAYYNCEANSYEPLLAGYQPNIKYNVHDNFRLNQLSLQRILKNVSAGVIIPDNDIIIRSIDTVQQYEKVMMQLCITNRNNAK